MAVCHNRSKQPSSCLCWGQTHHASRQAIDMPVSGDRHIMPADNTATLYSRNALLHCLMAVHTLVVFLSTMRKPEPLILSMIFSRSSGRPVASGLTSARVRSTMSGNKRAMARAACSRLLAPPTSCLPNLPLMLQCRENRASG